MKPEPIEPQDDSARAGQRAQVTRPNHTPDLSLLPWAAIGEVAAMMTEMLASGKHGRDDWRRQPVRYHLAHADAHMANLFDGDTSEDHLLHAACRLLMAVEQRREQRQGNPADRDRAMGGDDVSGVHGDAA